MPGPFFSPSFGLPNKCSADDDDDDEEEELAAPEREKVAKEGEYADPCDSSSAITNEIIIISTGGLGENEGKSSK